jgi:hypothetical protein
MPRGKARFDATSPKHPDWPEQPERALEGIAEENGAEYIDGSLTFSANGRIGHALFRTFEPGEDDRVTNFVRLAEALDAIELCVEIDADRWRRNREAQGQA